MWVSVWFVVVLVLAVAIMVLAVVKHFADQKKWRIWAHARNWQFIDSWPQMRNALTGGPFGRGSSRKVTLGYTGTFDSLKVSGFRYQYTTGSNKNRTTHYHSVLRVHIPRASFPFLTLSRENWASRALTNDIQFEDATFNRTWHVRSRDPRFAHDVIHPRMMEFLMGLDAPRMQTIWFEQDSLLISVKGNIDTSEVDGYLRLLTSIASRIPPFVLNNAGSERLAIAWNGPGISAEEEARRIAHLREQK